MKKCPACSYGNEDRSVKCGICGRDISAVRVSVPPAPVKNSYAMFVAAGLIAGCAALFFFMQNSPWRKEPPQVSGESAANDESSFSYDGVLYSLQKMSGLAFLPESDKLRVARLALSPDYRVSEAALELLGAWAADPADPRRRRWFSELLSAAETSEHISSRRRGALEAGAALALGFPQGDQQERIRQLAASLAAREEVDLKAGGFFLGAMAGLPEFEPRLKDALENDPRPYVKLYAACGLSRFGLAGGDDYLFGAAGGGGELQEEALYCSAFSVSPEAGKLLARVALESAGTPAEVSAKRSLTIRKQLAIIKK